MQQVLEAELKEIEEKARAEKEELRKQAAADMKRLLDQQTSTAKERLVVFRVLSLLFILCVILCPHLYRTFMLTLSVA